MIDKDFDKIVLLVESRGVPEEIQKYFVWYK
jgi:hypothetical protein